MDDTCAHALRVGTYWDCRCEEMQQGGRGFSERTTDPFVNLGTQRGAWMREARRNTIVLRDLRGFSDMDTKREGRSKNRPSRSEKLDAKQRFREIDC